MDRFRRRVVVMGRRGIRRLTFANLAPRSASLYKRYEQEFGEEFTSLHRKRILPFIY